MNGNANIKDKFRFVNSEQRSAEWIEFKKGKIGSSDAASIMGLNPWESKLACWERMVFGTQKEINENMQRGIELEPLALKWANENIECPPGKTFKPVVAQSILYPDLIASLDGWNGFEFIEIKCPRSFSKSISEHYMAQMQHQMFITNTHFCWYMEYVGGEAIVKVVQRDEKFIERMVVEELAFLSSIIDFIPPKPTENDWVVKSDPEKIKKASRYQQLTSLIEELETERKDIREEILHWSDHPRIQCGNLRVQKIMSKGHINFEKLLEDHPEIETEKYRKPQKASWRFTKVISDTYTSSPDGEVS